MVRKNVVSIFTGAMGLDLGLEMAGFEIKLAVEIDATACETIRLNAPSIPLIQNDIRDVSSEDILAVAGLENNQVDLIVGGSPCQSFSTAGRRRAFLDQRGQALLEFIRVIREIQPRYFILENVRGILSAALKHVPIAERGNRPLELDEEPGSVLKYVLNEFHQCGYYVNYKLINAADYGVPQKRERVVFLGSRDGEHIDFPEKTHSKTPNKGLIPWVTVGEVLEKLEGLDHHFVPYTGERLKYMQMVPKGGGNWRDLPEEVREKAMGGAYNSSGGRVGFFRRIKVNEPSPTLLTSPHQNATNLGHPYLDRPLSIEEYKVIQQFPNEWKIAGNINQQYTQIGNAVPVGLSYLLGMQIIKHMENKLLLEK